MKELSIEEKAKRYDEALEKAKIWQEHLNESGDNDYAKELSYIFPELKESEDERIRKAILSGIKNLETEFGWDSLGDVDILDAYAWLEKQGQTFTKKDVDDAYLKGVCDAKQELEKQGTTPKEVTLTYEAEVGNGNTKALITEKIQQPKFKVGDWIVWEGLSTGKIIKIDGDYYEVEFIEGSKGLPQINYVDRNFHLWTTQDAKGGDVLAVTMYSERVWIGIFKEYNGRTFSSYCYMDTEGIFHLGASGHGRVDDIHPATKEQHDILFKAMTDAGYEFDFDKKELKKIEQQDLELRK